MSRRGILTGLGVALAALALAACGSDGGGDAAGTAGTVDAAGNAPHTAAPLEELRTVVVFTGEEPAPSASPTRLNVGVVGGEPPAQPTVAEVLTDEECAPDAYGISHCLNELLLSDGSTLTVRHPHDMRVVPCLTPGETVELSPAG